jgi:hypothetical protein
MKAIKGTFFTEFRVQFSSVFMVKWKKETKTLNPSFSMTSVLGII